MNYKKHLIANLRIAAHAQKDAWAHLLHGLIPPLKIKHHQPPKSFPGAVLRSLAQNTTPIHLDNGKPFSVKPLPASTDSRDARLRVERDQDFLAALGLSE